MNASEAASENGIQRSNDRTASEPRSSTRDGGESPWHRRRWTTIVLEEHATGWRATQTGVDVEGRGETAAGAAADYCHRVSETSGDEPVENSSVEGRPVGDGQRRVGQSGGDPVG